MTYDEALLALHNKYPNDLVSIKYERSIHSDGREGSRSPEITVYVQSVGWCNTQSNFKDAIAQAKAEKDLINDIKESEEDESEEDE